MRPKDKLQESLALAMKMGFDVVAASPIEIELHDTPEFDRFLDELTSWKADLVMFSSATAVQSCIDLAARRRRSDSLLTGLSRTRVVAIGPATARKLLREGIEACDTPREFTSRGLVTYAKGLGLEGGKCYVLRSDKGTGELLRGLREAGLSAQEVIVYSLHRQADSREMQDIFEAGGRGMIDVYIFSSSLSASTFIETWAARIGIDKVREVLGSKKVAAIGQPTKNALESHGVRVDIVPARATFEDVLQDVKGSEGKSSC